MKEICDLCNGYGLTQSELGNVVCQQCGGFGEVHTDERVITIQLPEHIYKSVIDAVVYAAGMARMFDDPTERMQYMTALEMLKSFENNESKA